MSLPRPRGFSLMAALFLIIAGMLAALAMVVTSATRSRSTVLGFNASRAYFAAQAGLDIAEAQALGGTCGSSITIAGGIEGFSVNYTCIATNFDEAGTSVIVYALTSRAHSGSLGADTFVSRQVRSSVKSP